MKDVSSLEAFERSAGIGNYYKGDVLQADLSFSPTCAVQMLIQF